MIKLSSIAGHFKTITAHRHAVIRHCFTQGFCAADCCTIYRNILLQNLFPVCVTTAAHAARTRRNAACSDTAAHGCTTREETATISNTGRIMTPSGRCVKPVKMPIVFVAEMFCDRVAASKIYQGKNYTDSHPLEYFQSGKKNRFIHPETSDLIESWLIMLKEKGEAETLRHIRLCVKNGRY